MRRMLYYLSVITALSVVLSACQGAQPTALATEAPVTEPPANALPATELPATEAPVAPIDLAGPLMELGSRYMYVDGSILVAVPGGKFLMGSKNFGDKEREVTLGDFWIYSNKVTNGQFARCLESGKCTSPDLKNDPDLNNPLESSLPATGVNYDQAAAYCTFVHGRLPTEAEWEKTARGPDGNIFPWGDAAPVCDLLNFNFCKGKPTDVTDYPQGASYYGALDMSGNVREWVADWFSADYYANSPDVDPLGPETGEKRSVRGSSFSGDADSTFSARRFQLNPKENAPDLGFRCVVDDPAYFAPFCQTLTLIGADINGGPTDVSIPLPDDCAQSQLSGVEICPEGVINITVDNLAQGAQVEAPPPPTCIQQGNVYTCDGSNGGGSIKIPPQDCNVPIPPGGGQCPPGWDQDAQSLVCTGKGPGVNCMPGFNYNAASQCCMADNPAAKGFCPPGFNQPANACTSDHSGNSGPPQLAEEPFYPIICQTDSTVPGDDPNNPGGCVPVSCPPTAGNQNCVPKSCP